MSNETIQYDLVVIGGGPAGYAGAIKAGQLGQKVACVEMERAGGTCLNWGCIPSKALLTSAELYQRMTHSADLGFTVGDIDIDFPKVMKRSRNVADQMAKGVEFLFKKNKVDYVIGKARLNKGNLVEVFEGPDKGKTLSAKKVLIATGCKPRMIPGVEHDGSRIMNSRDALAMTKQPKSIVIIGAGAIGAEFAYFLNALGTKVTLVEMLPKILPVEDNEISDAVARAFKKQGIDCRTDTKVENLKSLKTKVTMDLVKGSKTDKVEAESVLVAIGVQANTEGLLGEGVSLEMDRNYIQTKDNYETSIEGVYAAGDIIGPPWLAHVATWEAVHAVKGMFEAHHPEKVKAFPGCTYCQPQVASIGKTEQKLKEEKVPYKVGKFPFTASGKAVASAHSEGFVKLLVSEDYGEILGAHIVGAEATELISEYVLGMKLEATAEEIHDTIHAHPTMSEALMEASAAVYGEAIHI
ncbi:MAG: dihydrolipoyl dehydrogenase [Verrucomicrobiota bacterium]